MLLIILIILSILFIYNFYQRKYDPPGPLGLPIIGSLHMKLIGIILKPWTTNTMRLQVFTNMKKKYGDIWSMRFGKTRIIVLANLDLITEAFIKRNELFSGRPIQDIYQLFGQGKGIIFSDGNIWKSNRQLAMKSLKELGMGKKDLEYRIIEEANQLIDYLQVNVVNTEIDTSLEFVKAVSNVISKLVFDNRDSYENPNFIKYVDSLQRVAHSSVPDEIVSIAPNLFKHNFINCFIKPVNDYFNDFDYLYRYIKKKCLEKINNNLIYESPTCVIDYFLLNRNKNNELINNEIELNDVIFTMMDLFSGGIDTTNNMLAFSFLFLGKYSEIQIELRNEIKNQTVDFQSINMEMRKSCPKLLSFIDEIFRYCVLVPRVHHRVLEDCEFANYRLKSDDLILGDLYTVFRDERNFINPNEFQPFRFINEDGKYIPDKKLIPFGIGKRTCLGESIAQMELFLFLSRILLKFKIELTKVTEQKFNEIVSGEFAIVHAPLKHGVLFKTV